MGKNRQQTLIEDVTGVVLAGGRSRRMGADKAFLRLGELTLVEHCVAALRECFAQSLIMANDPARFVPLGLPVFPD